MEIRDVSEQTTACINTTTSLTELPKVLGEGYGEIMGLIGKQGLTPEGPPYVLYRNEDMENLDIELGIPVAGDVDPEGRVVSGKLPGGKTAVAVHTGPYDTIGSTYEKLTGFIKEQGYEPEGLCWESYVDDPGIVPPEELKTEVFFPLK
jgi:effector-binding domain-containing protein